MKSWMLAAAMTLATGVAALADPVAGVWKTEPAEDGAHLLVSIAPCGADICGTIDKAFDPSGGAISNYEHQGKKMIWAMKAKGDGAYGGGKIWAPDTDKTYRSKMKLSGDSLKVEGCVAIICRGQTWSRVK